MKAVVLRIREDPSCVIDCMHCTIQLAVSARDDNVHVIVHKSVFHDRITFFDISETILSSVIFYRIRVILFVFTLTTFLCVAIFYEHIGNNVCTLIECWFFTLCQLVKAVTHGMIR